jgi:protein-S-isoprenylcysteine O-methyltransferase Ste14
VLRVPIEVLSLKEIIFIADIAVHYVLLFSMVWSVAFPKRQIWPPPKKHSWQYIIIWTLFYLALALNILLLLLDWNNWIISKPIRFFVGVPVIVIGSLLVSWGFATLGIKNTSGIKSQFIAAGPYRLTRNPQYLGDVILFAGIILFSNSLYVAIVHVLGGIVFLIAPLAEEMWLEQQYGNQYVQYKNTTVRFI